MKLAAALLFWCAAAGAQLPSWSSGPTPPLRLMDLEGKEHALEAYRGQVVLINFWATWCEPCREEMPSIERLRRSLQGRPFAVLAVNLAEPESRVQRFAREVPLGFPLLLDRDGATARMWKARMLPATYIVGPDGRIRYAYFGELDWSRDDVRQLIAALLPQ